MPKIIKRITISNHLLYALKIGFGSALAIYLAEFFHLEYSSSAGTITLLSIVGTKVETKQLGIDRLVTFGLTVSLALLFHFLIGPEWIGYGLVLVVLTFILSMRNLLTTLSVNAVALSHLLRLEKVGLPEIINECYLLALGLIIAVIINHLQNYESQKRQLQTALQECEKDLTNIFSKLAGYLKEPQVNNRVWDDIIFMERKNLENTRLAFQYQQNRLPLKDDFFADYFEMRGQQIGILHNLHYEMKKLRTCPGEAQIVATLFEDIIKYIDEIAMPHRQIAQVENLIKLIQEDNLPTSHEEFLSKARMYHILMDLEEFLVFKKRFVKNHAWEIQRQVGRERPLVEEELSMN